MIQLTLYSFIFMTSMVFLNITHPLAIGLTLLIQTIFICLISGLMTKSVWYSYILFLIFFSGYTSFIYLCYITSFKWMI